VPEDAAGELPPVTFTEAGVCHFASFRNVTVGVWVGRATIESARGLFSVGGQMSRRFPLGHSSFSFIRDKVAPPAPEVEALIKRTFGLGADLACMAVVLEGSGFWASGLRSLLEKLHRTGRGSVRLQIGTSLDEILAAFVDEHGRRTGVRFELAKFRSTLQHLRDEGAALALRPKA
jgi:hypothetical protein